jgi:hypothetical protein
MGAGQSKYAGRDSTTKHNSADSNTPLTRQAVGLSSPRSQTTFSVHDIHGHANISRPPPPPLIRRLSELIDPAELPIDSNVRSPSGNLLAPEQFLAHPDRPLSIRERQAEIREKVRTASRLGVEVPLVPDELPAEEDEEPSKCWFLKCSCF